MLWAPLPGERSRCIVLGSIDESPRSVRGMPCSEVVGHCGRESVIFHFNLKLPVLLLLEAISKYVHGLVHVTLGVM